VVGGSAEWLLGVTVEEVFSWLKLDPRGFIGVICIFLQTNSTG